MTKKQQKNPKLLKELRQNSRLNITSYAKKTKTNPKKTHYNYTKIKQNIKKYTTLLNLEKLGFKRTIIIFKNPTEGLATISKNSFYINNATRLDTGLLIEYISINEEEQKKFIQDLKNKKIEFTHHDIQEIIKQEETLT